MPDVYLPKESNHGFSGKDKWLPKMQFAINLATCIVRLKFLGSAGSSNG